MCGGAICGEKLEEVVRRPNGEKRWCFQCRSRRAFEYVVMAPVELSYYGPTPSIRCAHCGHTDSDLFPGRMREWEDE
jgi:hypothetical protein